MNTTKTILVIEDDLSFRRSLTAYLEDSGYRVVGVANGQEGLECLEREKPDVVLTDLRMPIMDGFEFMARVKLTNPGIPVIVITGTADTDAQEAVFDHGARACIFKPINDMQMLETIIERALASAL